METKLVRGSYQQDVFNRLTMCWSVESPTKREGKAKRYTDLYVKSFNGLIGRMTAAGYKVERTPGPRGGEWGATYKIVE